MLVYWERGYALRGVTQRCQALLFEEEWDGIPGERYNRDCEDGDQRV
jgi:hypothetical protein